MRFKISLKESFVRNWVTRKQKPEIPVSELKAGEIKIVDLFCGCGGITSGIVEASMVHGFKVDIVLAIDNNQDALNIYEDNFGQYSKFIVNQDIRDFFSLKDGLEGNLKERDLKTEFENIDILVAGPPCQGHSDLNNSTRRNDPRNDLYLSCIRAIDIISPNLVLIENVPTVIHSEQNVVGQTKDSLISRGYFVKELNINFLRLGIPQTRKRHILIASKDEMLISCFEVDDSEYKIPILKSFIKDLEDSDSDKSILTCPTKISSDNRKRIDFLFRNGLYDLPNSERPICHREKSHSYKSNYGRLNYSSPSQTITSGFGSMGQGRYIHPTRKRTITPREAARIQGFPNDFSFKRVNTVTPLRQMIANAVPPQLSYVFTKAYFEYLSSNKSQNRSKNMALISQDSIGKLNNKGYKPVSTPEPILKSI